MKIWVGVAIVTGLLGALAGAWLLQQVAERRDSRYYTWAARLLGPIGSTLWRDTGVATGLPYREDFIRAPLSDEWQLRNESMMQWHLREGALVARTTQECVWWHNAQAPLFAQVVEGDFDLTAGVRTRKASDAASFPDSNWQFGGIMLRDPSGDAWFSRESYVFNVVGYRGSGLQIETKSTRQAVSEIRSVDWSSGDAELRIRRRGDRFTMLARTDEMQWQIVAEYIRQDLPSRLQAGLILYSASAGTGYHDLEVTYYYVAMEPATHFPERK